MSQALNGINLESVSVSVEQKEVIRNIVVLKKDTYFFYLLWQGIYFSVIALCFWLPTWIVWMSILVVSPLIARSDREAKWFEGQHKIKVLLQSSVHSKSKSYENEDDSHSDLNSNVPNILSIYGISWLRTFSTWPVYLQIHYYYSKDKL